MTPRKQGDATSAQHVRVGVPRKGLLHNPEVQPGLAFCTIHGTLLCPLFARFKRAAAQRPPLYRVSSGCGERGGCR